MRPRAAADVNLMHLALLPLGRPLWVAGSWLMSWTHLGLLREGGGGLGWSNAVTLLRANLPVWGRVLGPWAAVPALAGDLLDGRLARARGEVSAFGAYADPLADVAFWIWYAGRYEPSRPVRVGAALLWAAPALGVTAYYFVAGRSVEVPRLRAVRYLSAGFQLLLAARAAGRLVGRAPHGIGRMREAVMVRCGLPCPPARSGAAAPGGGAGLSRQG